MRLSARARAGALTGVIFGLFFAAALVPIATVEGWLGLSGPLDVGDTAKVTLRRPPHGAEVGEVVVARGETVTPEGAALLPEAPAGKPAPTTLVGLGVSFFLIGLLLCAYLRTTPRGRLVRVQLTLLGFIILFAAFGKAALLLTGLSWLLAPTASGAFLACVIVDRYAGFGVAVALGLVAAALLPFEPAVAIILSTQGVAGVLVLSRPRRRRAFLLAGTVGGLAAALAYLGLSYLYGGHFSAEAELAAPFRSGLIAAFAGGILSAPLALAVRAAIEALAGDIPRARLVELADLENPLLKKIAAEAPGTWQHSLAMANMAEICANAIGANALLVRVGAYYHDLGKSLQPQYYIENLAAGQTSPHDELPPETSADAIFAHVTEGVRLARAHSLPAAVIDFMHMHHGDGLLEYFWGKCLEEGNPKNLGPDHFRYPGVKPQSRETAILAICDAVEAASRTLHKPDARAIETLVQRIVYGKLHNGQLDESSLAVSELKKLANTLVDTLKHAHHVRIEYPWQKEERARAQAAAGATAATTKLPPAGVTSTGAFVLDSADAPRPSAQIKAEGGKLKN